MQNYTDLNTYYKNIQTPPVYKITSRNGYTTSDNRFLTQKTKNIMINEDGTSGGYNYLLDNGHSNVYTGSSNYGYPNLKATEELLKSMNQKVYTNPSPSYHSFSTL